MTLNQEYETTVENNKSNHHHHHQSGSGQFTVVHTNGTQLQDPLLGNLYISSDTNTNAEMLNNTMVHNLEVNGSTKINGDIRFSGDLYKNDVLFTWGTTNIHQSEAKTGINISNPSYGIHFNPTLNTGVFEDRVMVNRATSGEAVVVKLADNLKASCFVNYH